MIWQVACIPPNVNKFRLPLPRLPAGYGCNGLGLHVRVYIHSREGLVHWHQCTRAAPKVRIPFLGRPPNQRRYESNRGHYSEQSFNTERASVPQVPNHSARQYGHTNSHIAIRVPSLHLRLTHLRCVCFSRVASDTLWILPRTAQKRRDGLGFRAGSGCRSWSRVWRSSRNPRARRVDAPLASDAPLPTPLLPPSGSP